MPGRNIIREFAADNYYHVYNRGVEKRLIYMDNQDYNVFLDRLRRFLDNPEKSKVDKLKHRDRLKSFYGRVELLTFCLMPNHFHLLLYQTDETAIAEFMRALSTSYTMYFNLKYKRVGSLFQGRYKAKLVKDEGYWQHISRYIHLNPEALGVDINTYPYSSMKDYLKSSSNEWVKPSHVLKGFTSIDEYKKFVQDYVGRSNSLRTEFDID